ncbi:GH92 family glycosyl hydrolase [Pedobacter sp. ASV1-7]|uniref:GH92 family glycosyl hydrolase n=1 Tax=Pedobacter sp. ASV1-7 TaxID=3145237 RepID=UPI0032E8B2D8
MFIDRWRGALPVFLNRGCIIFSVFVIVAILGACSGQKQNSVTQNYVKFVDPLIGSGGHGHVFVGASVPHGMVQVGPNNLTKGWDWCSGYHDSDSTIIGFAQTHLSGTGIADLGDIIFMPATNVSVNGLNDTTSFANSYVSTFKKSNQVVYPGYYSVYLDRYAVKAELTATTRTSIQKYTFPKDSNAQVIINLEESVQSLEARKGTLMSGLTIVNDSTVTGYRVSDEWAKDHKVYFTTIFSKPVLSSYFVSGTKVSKGVAIEGLKLNGVFSFNNSEEPLLVKTGISYVSEKGALANLQNELPGWNFEDTKEKAVEKWNQSLSKYDFKAKDSLAVTKFYTALYHTQISPSVFNDVDGKYRGADGEIYMEKNFTPYTVFSLWDTYRAVHPLYTLTDTTVADYAKSLLAINTQQKRMPVWHLVGNETDCMVGTHSIPVVIDAYLKGFKLDQKQVWDAVKDFDQYNQNGLNQIRETGYIAAEKEPWSVAKGLESAIDSYAIAQLAKKSGNQAAYDKYQKYAKNYHHYFDKESGFMRGKLSNGSWNSNFNPFFSKHLEDDYVEGNAWQYTWLVPHDVEGLIALFGGEQKFKQKLDSLFLVKSELNEGASIDITGMIGQYAHGNEPSHHILYLYPFVGEQWKTAEKVRTVFDKFYKATPNGLIGNEDCGQMSAWYIFSSLGFYPVNPVNGVFVFGSPLADEVNIKLNNGKAFSIKSNNNSAQNKYIQSIKLNGKPYTKSYITYQQIMQGGELIYSMGKTPNYEFGKNKADRPVSDL